MPSNQENSEYTAVVAHYYPKRHDYMRPVVEALTLQTLPPSDIIIWDNSKSMSLAEFRMLEYNPLCPTIVGTNRNDLMGRYAAAICLAKTPHILIVDDDLILGKDAVKTLMHHHRMGQITGMNGVVLNKVNDHPYNTGKWVAGRVDVVQGRCFLADRMALLPGLRHIIDTGLQPEAMDDILFSLACGRCVAVAGVKFENLDEHGQGLSHVPDWMEQRDKAALFYMKEFGTK